MFSNITEGAWPYEYMIPFIDSAMKATCVCASISRLTESPGRMRPRFVARLVSGIRYMLNVSGPTSPTYRSRPRCIITWSTKWRAFVVINVEPLCQQPTDRVTVKFASQLLCQHDFAVCYMHAWGTGALTPYITGCRLSAIQTSSVRQCVCTIRQ